MEKVKKVWANSNQYAARRSAQSYFNANQVAENQLVPCGSSCGSDNGETKLVPCGSSCGSSDDTK